MLDLWHKYGNWIVYPSMTLVLISRYFYTYFSDEARDIILIIALSSTFIKVLIDGAEYLRDRNKPDEEDPTV